MGVEYPAPEVRDGVSVEIGLSVAEEADTGSIVIMIVTVAVVIGVQSPEPKRDPVALPNPMVTVVVILETSVDVTVVNESTLLVLALY